MDITRLAAIDIGSNSVKLLISDVINHDNKIVYKNSSFTRVPLQLGEDTFYHGFVTDAKKEKLATLIKTFVSLAQINDAQSWVIYGTSALREAKNASEVLDYVLQQTGCNIQIISPSQEAHLVGLNLMNENLDSGKIYVIADVGGGGTDMMLFAKDRLPVYGSFNLGTIRTLSAAGALREWSLLEEWIQMHRNGHRDLVLVGSGGNINKIGSLFGHKKKMKRYDLSSYYKRLCDMDYDERVLNSSLNLNRAKVILPALRIYLHIMKVLRKDEIEIPVIGLADGMIKEMYRKINSKAE